MHPPSARQNPERSAPSPLEADLCRRVCEGCVFLKKRDELKGGAEKTQTILDVRCANPNLKPSPSVWLYVCPYFASPPPTPLSSLPCGDAATLSIFQLDPGWKNPWKSLCVHSAARPSILSPLSLFRVSHICCPASSGAVSPRSLTFSSCASLPSVLGSSSAAC